MKFIKSMEFSFGYRSKMNLASVKASLISALLSFTFDFDLFLVGLVILSFLKIDP